MRAAARRAALALACAALAGCATVDPAKPVPPGWQAPVAGASSAGWRHYRLPGKVPAEFRFVRQDGRAAVLASASSAVSLLRHTVHVTPQDLGSILFSWKVPQLIDRADLAVRDRADSPVRVVLAFEGDRSRFGARDAALSELAHALTGEPMPYATLMYVWCNVRAPGTVIRSPRTDRVRKIVVESGPANLDRWLEYRRDIRADFERAFGEPPGALVGVAIMTDSDNTHTETRAWYGQPRLLPFSGNPF